jgi:hypothetical protein
MVKVRHKLDAFDTDGNMMLRGLCRLWLGGYCSDEELVRHIVVVGHSTAQATAILESWKRTDREPLRAK